MRLVLDTNVLVSALFWDGNERRVLRACVEGPHILVTSPALLAEVERVLADKFAYPRSDLAAYLGLIERAAEVVKPQERLTVVVADPADDRVLECAIEGRADAIVTGDRHLLRIEKFRGVGIIRASKALE